LLKSNDNKGFEVHVEKGNRDKMRKSQIKIMKKREPETNG